MVSEIDSENVVVAASNVDALDSSTLVTHGINTAERFIITPDYYSYSENNADNINQFIVRMQVSPFHHYLAPEISPVHHTRRLPEALGSLSFVDKEPIEAEWKAIFHHWNDVLQREKATLLKLTKGSLMLPIFLLASTFNLGMFFSICLDQSKIEYWYLKHEPSIFGMLFKMSYYSLPVPLWMLFIKDIIHTHLRHGNNNNYNSRSTSTINIGSTSDNSIDTTRHYQSTVTAKHLILQFDNMSGCVLSVGIFGFWFVAILIVYQIEHYGLVGWWYLATPMVLVSLYVLYHIGGCTAICSSYSSRFEKHNRQSADLLKKVYFEIKGQNDLLTYFILRPKIKFDSRTIVVDVYAKVRPIGIRLKKASMNLGVTKRRGGGNIVMMDGSTGSDDQQPLRTGHPHHCEDDGLTTPLLKDTII